MANFKEFILETIIAFGPLLTLFCMCKVFSDRGEPFWKALVPFYSHLVFGRLAGDEKKGSNMMSASLLTVLCAIGFYGSLIAVYRTSPRSTAAEFLTLLFLLLMCVSFLATLIFGILLKVKFVEKEKDSGWIALLFAIFPPFGYFYYAFLKG